MMTSNTPLSRMNPQFTAMPPATVRFGAWDEDDESFLPRRSVREREQAPKEDTEPTPQAPEKGFFRKWMGRLFKGTALVAGAGVAGAAIAAGPLGGADTVEMKRAYHAAATADQEFTNSRIIVNDVEYNGGIDPKTGLGYIILDRDEFVTLTQPGPNKRFRNEEGLPACALQELGRWVAGEEHANRETVDFINTTGRTLNGQPLDVLIQIDNRQLERNHSNLNIKTGAPKPKDCTDIPADLLESGAQLGNNIYNGARDVGNSVVDGITEFGDWLNPFN